MLKKKIIIFAAAFSIINIALALDDTEPPNISDVEWQPEYPAAGDLIIISATITDESGVQLAQLFYCFDGNCYPPINMQGSNGKYYAQIGPFEEGRLEFHITAQDTVGNVGSTREYSIFIDGTAPTVRVIFPNGGENLAGIVKIKWEAEDNADNSPDIEIEYSNDNGMSWHYVASTSNSGEYSWNTSSLEDGKEYLIKITAIDNAGNSNHDISDSTFTIDNTPPITNISLEGESYEENWFISNVTVTLNAFDKTSGIDVTKYRLDNLSWIDYTEPFYVTENGQHYIEYYSIDKAGNEENVKSISFNIDKNPPVLEIKKPKKGYIYIFGREAIKTLFGSTIIFGKINIEANASDEISGIKKVEFYIDGELKHVDNETPYEWLWDEAAFLKHTIKVKAYNNAGNFAVSEMNVWIFNL